MSEEPEPEPEPEPLAGGERVLMGGRAVYPLSAESARLLHEMAGMRTPAELPPDDRGLRGVPRADPLPELARRVWERGRAIVGRNERGLGHEDPTAELMRTVAVSLLRHRDRYGSRPLPERGPEAVARERESVLGLPPKASRTLVLFVAGRSPADIATELGMTRKAVDLQLMRTRGRLGAGRSSQELLVVARRLLAGEMLTRMDAENEALLRDAQGMPLDPMDELDDEPDV